MIFDPVSGNQVEARRQRALAVAKRRGQEKACAWDFLITGDRRVPHAKFCAFPDDPCSRAYSTVPYRQTVGWVDDVPTIVSARQKSLPAGEEMYEGTGIGALYGIRGSEQHLWQLAGWNLTRSKDGGKSS